MAAHAQQSHKADSATSMVHATRLPTYIGRADVYPCKPGVRAVARPPTHLTQPAPGSSWIASVARGVLVMLPFTRLQRHSRTRTDWGWYGEAAPCCHPPVQPLGPPAQRTQATQAVAPARLLACSALMPISFTPLNLATRGPPACLFDRDPPPAPPLEAPAHCQQFYTKAAHSGPHRPPPTTKLLSRRESCTGAHETHLKVCGCEDGGGNKANPPGSKWRRHDARGSDEDQAHGGLARDAQPEYGA